MGPPREDYEKVAPKDSFIHVDDFDGAQDLARYLNKLDNKNELYNKYFGWKVTKKHIHKPDNVCKFVYFSQTMQKWTPSSSAAHVRSSTSSLPSPRPTWTSTGGGNTMATPAKHEKESD